MSARNKRKQQKKFKQQEAQKQQEELKQNEKLERKEAFRKFMHHFKPLIYAVVLWFAATTILHLPALKESVQHFFVKFTLDTSVGFGKLLFFPITSSSFPYITVSGYTMEVIMECTAYNFYIFVIFLSLFSPVSWKQRLITLLIFLGSVFVVNSFRFITMGYIGKWDASMFHYIHDYLWNILFGIMVFLIWYWRYRPALREIKEQKTDQETN